MKKIVITGGPGSGKTVITRAIVDRHTDRFALVPEAATQVYTLLNTRWDKLDLEGRRNAQRQMYRLQRDQESRIAAANPTKILLLDRATIDGAAYWPDGPDDFWADRNTARAVEFARYDAVILLETCAAIGKYDGDESNPVRFEDAAAAITAGELLHRLWSGHPRLHVVNACENLDDKIANVRKIIAAELTRS
jgi:predicted ATPase